MSDDVTNFDETNGRLIAAKKVDGTKVYNPAGESLGSVYDVLIEKTSGKATYAIMSLGGFLGMGKTYHPLPWSQLRYDPELGGYVVDLDKTKLQGAPHYEVSQYDDWGAGSWESDINAYYGLGILGEPATQERMGFSLPD